MKITVVERTSWHFGKNNCGYGGMSGQLTKCLFEDNIEFYVRENLKGIDTFLISSSERWGDKQSLGSPRKARQSLDLLAPEQHWDRIAEAVREADCHKRPVYKAKGFTWKWAEGEFSHRITF